ncbi:intermembrane phospholipid transport protein YdbH family protein [Aurantiacibacter aquimixticola]|nr:YdbH domain-containing protein [Aurantiacibacter aquimixticola]
MGSDGETGGRGGRRWLRWTLRIVSILLVLALITAWLQRKEIAETLIDDTFADAGVEASYDIERIGLREQVLTDIVLGNPARPDFTADRLELRIRPQFGLPDITEVTLTEPRIYGVLRDGELSFGQLDPLIFGEETGEPFEFPDVELFIDDGRGLLETEFGRIGLKLAGGGHLRGGFAAEVAAVADELSLRGCAVERPTLYGELSIDAERPAFDGPLRFEGLRCEDAGLALADGTVDVSARAERNLQDVEGQYALALGPSSAGTLAMDELAGEGRFSWRDGTLNALYDVTASALQSDYAAAQTFTIDGRLRAVEGFGNIQLAGEVSGEELRMGGDLDSAIAQLADAGRGTLVAPLANRLGLNLAREMRGSTLAGRFDARLIGDIASVIVPEARLRGGSGQSVLALSRIRLTNAAGMPRFSGDLATGGEGLPRITGRVEQAVGGASELRLTMREYASGNSRLTVPRLSIFRSRDGRITLDGQVLASGPLPGGFAQGLVLPVDGTIAPDGSLALWNGCRNLRFEWLRYANLTLGRQSLTLCPPSTGSILGYGENGLRIAAGTTELDLAGTLAETPIRLSTGAVGFAYPGAVSARDLDIALGPADNAQRFTITDVTANFGTDAVTGTITGADVFLASVPLDIVGLDSAWRYAGQRLSLSQGSFTLEDRQAPFRFEPLVTRDATLTLADNRITADALLRYPQTDVAIADADIVHDLSTGRGEALLDVPGVTFGSALQPLDLTRLALGVVANVEGTVTGEGRIAWAESGVTSTGAFSTDDLDLAAAFGPVRGASGTVVFTDLLGLTTAPDQRIALEAVNPGIEIYEGEMGFQLIDGERIEVTGGRWPFLGGTLSVRPVTLNIGVQESRTYIIDVAGLEAPLFIERMGLSNLTADGIFDGTIPIVFDADGNGRLIGGTLQSRPPGGNVAYIGELTYENLGTFGNLAFEALRDLSYEEMTLAMDGPLTGELVTRVRFSGVGQGETAERNIVTRAVAQLPIDLRINIRAPFYKLISTLRALYDPMALRDPRSLGLIGADGTVLRDAVDQDTVDAMDEAAAEQAERELRESLNASEPDIQPQESEETP